MSINTIGKLLDRPLAASRPFGGVSRLHGTGVSGAAAARASVPAAREAAAGRPTQAPVAVMAIERNAYAFTTHVTGAGHQLFGQQKTQLHTMWALRGLDPWSDPA
ncbi:hypothetical protein [Streptomyces hoynatensis]|uniref:hypothetical protein n=1 Tax=Streptomyces hoynatensis TaxID=1141874 RepID=UPI002685338F